MYDHSMTEQEVRDMAAADWIDANYDRGCSCHMGHPPCSFCVDGFSLPIDEYVEQMVEDHFPPEGFRDFPVEDSTASDYDRAMDLLR